MKYLINLGYQALAIVDHIANFIVGIFGCRPLFDLSSYFIMIIEIDRAFKDLDIHEKQKEKNIKKAVETMQSLTDETKRIIKNGSRVSTED